MESDSILYLCPPVSTNEPSASPASSGYMNLLVVSTLMLTFAVVMMLLELRLFLTVNGFEEVRIGELSFDAIDAAVSEDRH